MINQEKALRSQAEQRSIDLLTERKNWETTVSEREKEIVELKTKLMELEEKEKDLMIEMKVGDSLMLLDVDYCQEEYYYCC